MPKLLEKIKNFFCGKFVCKAKKPTQPASGEESKPPLEEPKAEESKTKGQSPF